MSSIQLGQHFAHVLPGTSASAIIAPTANTNGAYIRTVYAVAGAPSAGTAFVLYADPNQPLSYSDTNRRAFFWVQANANQQSTFIMPYEVQIPAGWGLWAISDLASAWAVIVTYDILA